ncbi:MAG TPA: YggS family pyridoxal phosphate-dependent enzyme [Tissierellaceae bacterium]|nr:YggS family pyridoxal phosphate-dependent enzyme [Tissierellaceae bacterium]
MEEIKISIRDNIINIEKNIEDALIKSGRTDKVELIAVTKTVDIERIKTAMKLGIDNIGENRVQEFEKKYKEIGRDINYHMIGHLQSNKVKHLIGKTRLIHSLDRMSLVKELNKRSKNENLVTDVLIQVNVSEEKTKFGLKIENVLDFIEKVLKYENVRVRGLMTIAPYIDDEIELRRIFKTLYNLKEEIILKNYKELSMDFLSMGMTNDYKIAIEEGSNMIRIGTGIFGERNY